MLRRTEWGRYETYRIVAGLGMEGGCVRVIVRFGASSTRCANRLDWHWGGHCLPGFHFWSDWWRRRKVWAVLRYLLRCIWWCPKVFCRMRTKGRVNLWFARFRICRLGWISVRELVGGRSLIIWGAGDRDWAAMLVIRFSGDNSFYDIPRLASVEIQVNGHLPREALSKLPTIMKVPPWMTMLDEPLNMMRRKNRQFGWWNRARPVREEGVNESRRRFSVCYNLSFYASRFLEVDDFSKGDRHKPAGLKVLSIRAEGQSNPPLHDIDTGLRTVPQSALSMIYWPVWDTVEQRQKLRHSGTKRFSDSTSATRRIPQAIEGRHCFSISRAHYFLTERYADVWLWLRCCETLRTTSSLDNNEWTKWHKLHAQSAENILDHTCIWKMVRKFVYKRLPPESHPYLFWL